MGDLAQPALLASVLVLLTSCSNFDNAQGDASDGTSSCPQEEPDGFENLDTYFVPQRMCDTDEDCPPGHNCVVLCEEGVDCIDPDRGALTQTFCILSEEGVWLAPDTGLSWQVHPPLFDIPPEGWGCWPAPLTWDLYLKATEASRYCDSLDLDGHTDWRLPTAQELRSLIRGCPETEANGICDPTLSECMEPWVPCETCRGCEKDAGPANGCYWPDSIEGLCKEYHTQKLPILPDGQEGAWKIDFRRASIIVEESSWNDGLTRCVR